MSRHDLRVLLGRRRRAGEAVGTGVAVFIQPACVRCGWEGRRYTLDAAGDRAMQAELGAHGRQKRRRPA